MVEGGLPGVGEGNVLMTCSSAKVPLLRALQVAAGHPDVGMGVVVGDADGGCLTAQLDVPFWKMPPVGDMGDDYLDGLREREVRAVLPTSDRELAFHAERSEELDAAGIRVAVSSPSAIRDCLDKLRFSRRCREAGIPAIETTLAEAGWSLVEGADRYVVKERRGAGSKALHLGLASGDVDRVAADLIEPVVQPMAVGQEFSVDAYSTLDGRFVGGVARSRDLVVDGESRITTVVEDRELVDVAREVGDLFDLRGHFVVQAFRDESGIRVVECNPRVGGASTLSFAAGLDSLRWFLLEATGRLAGRPEPPRRVGRLRLVRVSQDVIG